MNNKKIKVIQSYPVWQELTQIWLYNLVHYLPDTIESHIVCERTKNLDQFWVPNIHALMDSPKWRYYWDKGLRKLKIRRHLQFLVDVAKRENATILHSHFGHLGWENLDAAKLAGLKHVVSFYGWEMTSLIKNEPHWRQRYQDMFNKVDLVLACEGPYMAQCIVDLGCPPEKVKVNRLSVISGEIAFKPREWYPGEPLKVLIAASFREKKGITYALEALGQFQERVPLEITLIGDANSEPRSQQEKQKIMAVIDKYKLQNKVRMLGYQPYPVFFEEAYKHHIFLSPSINASDGDTEAGIPYALVDMAATGMPIVSTKNCDIPSLILNGVRGLLAEERDVPGLITHLQWLVDNPEKWYDMVVAARDYVQGEYDAHIQGEKLAELYSQLT
ncbi:MAG: colanic acid biosynthesis glycosyltransferase WcaL [Symploca sp. SIO3E6]|nr:colanic acid biosynthesis glycosyltransferase WcaL [Caldora sp. SIO3E6]